MFAVPIVAPPVTTPVPDITEAVPGALLVHVPPPGVPVNVIEEPAQTDVGPPIDVGIGLTVTPLVLKQPVENM